MIYIDSNTCPYVVDIIKIQPLKYPPTVNRSGKTRSTNDIKSIITVKTNLVNVPTLIASDLHSHTEKVLNDLESNNIDISKYLVLTLGDMAGDGVFGSDGDPTEFYERIVTTSKLHLVQGNHDLPPSNDINRLIRMRNKDKTWCYMPDGTNIINTPNGTMGGVHGIISHKPHPYKKSSDIFYNLVENILKKRPYILMTHETPEIPYYDSNVNKIKNLIGKTELYNMVIKYKPKIHMYGHCYHPYAFIYTNNIMFINADSRIILLEPL